VKKARITPTEQLHNEWLVATLRPNSMYSVPVTRERPTAAGGSEAFEEIQAFHVVDVVHGNHRPSLIHTAATADDPVMAMPIAVSVKLYDMYDHSGETVAGTMHVFPEADVEWVQPARLAPINILMQRMSKWSVVQPSDTQGVLILSGEQRATPVFALDDEKCPVLTMAQALIDRGWKTEQRTIVHKSVSEDVMDSRSASRMRFYFQVLLRGLPRCLPVCGFELPSQQPQAFYRLILLGVPCKSGLPAKTYQVMLNNARARQGLEMLPLPEHEQPEPLPPPADAVMLLPLEGEELVRRARGGGGRGPLRAGRGRGQGRGRGHEDPGPAFPIPLPPAPPSPDVVPSDVVVAPEVPEDGVLLLPRDAEEEPPTRKRKGVPLVWFDALDGAMINFTPYTHPTTGAQYLNYHITCGNKEHAGGACQKTKGSTFSPEYEGIGPIAFLQAWREMPWPAPGCKGSHRLENPSAEDVARWVRERGDDLRRVWRTLQGGAEPSKRAQA